MKRAHARGHIVWLRSQRARGRLLHPLREEDVRWGGDPEVCLWELELLEDGHDRIQGAVVYASVEQIQRLRQPAGPGASPPRGKTCG